MNLDQLCAKWGIDTAYADIWGHLHPAPESTKRELLEAMGALDPASSEPTPAAAEVVEEGAQPRLALTADPHRVGNRVRFRLVLESNDRYEGECAVTRDRDDASGRARYYISLPESLPSGYHTLELSDGADTPLAVSSLAVAPTRCFAGRGRAAHDRMFGPAVQLYALRSRRNWGMGDFTDLRLLVDIASRNGADFVGVNPLHALFANRPAEASPYSPSNRTMLNPLYIDVEAVDDFATCEPARERVASAEFQRRIAELRAAPLVDYAGVSAFKREVLQWLYRHFREHDLEACTQRARSFRDFQQRGGDALLYHALHDALGEWLHGRDPACWGTPVWPPEYRDARSPAVLDFLATHRDEVEFFQYLQWQASAQLDAVAAHAEQVGMAIGLYRDLAVGVNASGSEVWHEPWLFASAVHVGAPPDEFNQKGQDWGLPPWIPARLTEARYRPWIDVLRANMRAAGALRIDHVMGLMRLYWIPSSADARAGAYVRYAFDAMLGVLALESVRSHCIVVGEDLGTVPDAVREAMARLRILSYRVLLFEHAHDGSFARPAAYPAEALCTFSTHDLPTLHGFVVEADLGMRDALDLFPDEEARAKHYALRRDDRVRLQAALRDAGLLSNDAASTAALQFSDDLREAVHAYLARTPSRLMSFQLEDVFGVIDQINMPSTRGDRYPNWRRKLPVDLEDWPGDGRFDATCAVIRSQGRGRRPGASDATAEAKP